MQNSIPRDRLLNKFARTLSFGGLLLLVISSFSTTTYSQSSFAVRSLGMQKCDAFIQNIQSTSQRGASVLYSQWLAGYLTAKNASSNFVDVFPIRDPLDEWLRFIALICSVNQEKRLVEVTEGAILALKDYAVVLGDKTVEIKYKEKNFIVYKKFLEQSQLYLKSRGYKVSVDGVYGRNTEAAFSKYKKDNKISGPPLPDSFFLASVLGQ